METAQETLKSRLIAMRIVQVIAAKGYGGAEKHTLMLSKGLIMAGHELICVVPIGSWIEKECLTMDLPVKAIRFRGNYDLFAMLSLRRLITKWHADIVHGQLTRGSRYANLAAMGTRAIPVNTCHATSSHKHMRGCRKIIAVSQAVAANLVKHHYRSADIRVIYNGVPIVETSDRKTVREELGIRTAEFAVVCVGRFVSDKGQKCLIEIIDTLDDTIHLYFVGDDATDYGREMRRLAADHPRIHFLGYRSDVTRLLSAFDLCAAPSRREALSIALIEASQAGLPAVATRVGGIPEVVTDDESGILFTRDHHGELKEALHCLARDPELRGKFGSQAYQNYLRKFTLDQMVTATVEVYADLLA